MKKVLSAVLAFAMMVSMVSCSDSSKADDGDYIYGQIESISGNDVVVNIAQPNEKSDDSGSDDASSSSDSSGSRRSKGNFNPKDFSGSMPDGFDPQQFKNKRSDNSDDSDNSGRKRPTMPDMSSMPDGFDPEKFKDKLSSGSDDSDSNASRKMPDMPDMSNLPDGFDPKDFSGSMLDGFSRPDGAGRRSSGKSSGNYTLTGEKQELRIPVGTSVTTSSGVKSGFDALKKGNIIKCSVEKGDNGEYTVKEVWIMDK